MIQLWGYSWDRLEIGGALSSSMVHMGLGLLFTEGRPLIGMMIGTALGGVDTYIRYDLFSQSKIRAVPRYGHSRNLLSLGSL